MEASGILGTGNTNGRERLNTIGPLIKVSFYKKVNNVYNTKSSLSKLVSTRRSSVLSLPIQLGFPGMPCEAFRSVGKPQVASKCLT